MLGDANVFTNTNEFDGTTNFDGATNFCGDVVIDGALSGTSVKDEDTMASDSATAVPTQQSVKAYVYNLTYLSNIIVHEGDIVTTGGEILWLI